MIGGYAVCYHGYYRNTNDIDFWIAIHSKNAKKMTTLIKEFGFDAPEICEELFLQKGRLIRMGLEPTRIEILTEISACEFADCYERRIETTVDEIPAKIINLSDLIRNKIHSGRLKDLDDVQHLT